MDEKKRKYGIIFADNNSGELKVIIDTFKNYGAVVSDNSNGLGHIIDWNVPSVTLDRWGSFKKLVDIAGDLEFHFTESKRAAVSYVSDHLDSIDLVMMNLMNRTNPEDLTGFNAAKILRDKGYKNWIAVRTNIIIDDKISEESKKLGINDIFPIGSVDLLYGFMADRYSLDRN